MKVSINLNINQPPNPNVQMEAYLQTLIEAHRRGEHPWGSMNKQCPLCQGRGS